MNGIEIRKVQTRNDLKNFIRFPWRVYESDPHWVPPLIMEMKDKLNRRKHPFFEHGEADYFLARFADLDLVIFAEHQGRTVGFAGAF